MNPLISVLLVAHNAGDYLTDAVNSILGQSHRHLELLLVDNASTDSSIEATKRAYPDQRLKILHLPQNRYHNGGLIAGLPHCIGDYIAVMDADDISLPRRLEKQLRVLENDPSLGGIGCAAETIDHRGTVTGREFTLCDSKEINLFSQYGMPFVFPTLLGRRQLFIDFPFSNKLSMAHDLDLVGRALNKYKLSCLPEVLFHYRRHPHSSTSSKLTALLAYASVVRLAHARRRASRSEEWDKLLAEKKQLLRNTPKVAEIFAHYSKRALEESLLFQAVWHARKAARSGASLAGVKLLAQTIGAGRCLPVTEKKLLWRFAILGTVRAYRLHPV